MNLGNLKYVYAENIEEFSNLSIRVYHNKTRPKHRSIYHVLQVNKILNASAEREVEYLLKTGVLDNAGRFFMSPWKIGYILLRSVYCSSTHIPYLKDKDIISFALEIYKMDYSDCLPIDFRFENARMSHPLDHVSDTINFLNFYIQAGNELDLLDIDKVKEAKYYEYSKVWYLDQINNLDFEFTAFSQNRVGKDNYFWVETEVINLPSDSYTKELVLSNLKFDDKRTSGYSPAEPPLKFSDKNECERIKRDLINSTIDKFDSTKQLFARHQITGK